MRLRPAAAGAVAALLAAAAPAAASQLDVAVAPPGAQLGDAHTATGRMKADDGTPMAGRRISLEVRPYPFTGRFRPIDHTTTDEKGRFRFRGIALDRNADVRVVAFDGTTSGIARAFTYPSHDLTYRALDARHIRFTQTYRTPRDVKLTRRTFFYVGKASRPTAPIAAKAKTTRTRKGRFRSQATITLPKSWKGRFHYASCFRYSPGSGMGDPAQGCPRRYAFAANP
jgi:hypothetical protein